jgi:primase-polymerase (primpol)-like protein
MTTRTRTALTDAELRVLRELLTQGYGAGVAFIPEQVYPARNNQDNAARRTIRWLGKEGLFLRPAAHDGMFMLTDYAVELVPQYDPAAPAATTHPGCAALPLNTAQIPDELRALPWGCWRWKPKDRDANRWTKPPINPADGTLASVDDSTTWGSFRQALAYHAGPATTAGIGCLLADGITGVDLDGCRDPETGEIDPDALAIVRALGSYAEISPSGTGVKVFCRGALPGPNMTPREIVWSNGRAGAIELYDHARYFTVTGHRLPDAPATIEDAGDVLAELHRRYFGRPAGDGEKGILEPLSTRSPILTDDEIIERATNAKNGAKFARLFAGDEQAHDGNDRTRSAADQSLCNLIAFWTQDEAQLERIFQRSGLYRPDRWRGSYRRSTLAKACARRDVYTPPAISTNGNRRNNVDNINILDTPGTPPGTCESTSFDSCADVRAENAQLRAERDQWRERAIRAEAQTEQLARERTLIIDTLNNPANRQRMAVAFAVQAIAESTISRGLDTQESWRGKDKHEGWAPIHYSVIEKRTGVPYRTVQRQIAHLCDEGIFAKHVTRLRPGDVDPATGEILDDWTSSVIIQPQPSFTALCEVMRDTVLPPEREQGGARCTKHPDADVIVATRERTLIIETKTCSVCGDELSVTHRLKRQDGISEDEQPADDLKRQDDISAHTLRGRSPNTRQHGISALRDTCRDCGQPLLSMIEREFGRCTRYCEIRRDAPGDIAQQVWPAMTETG